MELNKLANKKEALEKQIFDLNNELSIYKEDNAKCYKYLSDITEGKISNYLHLRRRDLVINTTSENNVLASTIEKREKKKIQKSNNKQINGLDNKFTSIDQLLRLIGDILESKREFDKLSKRNKSPRETLEQYLYTYFGNKYGIKTIVASCVESLINALKTYSSENTEIIFFVKALKNEIHEEYYWEIINHKDRIKTTFIVRISTD